MQWMLAWMLGCAVATGAAAQEDGAATTATGGLPEAADGAGAAQVAGAKTAISADALAEVRAELARCEADKTKLATLLTEPRTEVDSQCAAELNLGKQTNINLMNDRDALKERHAAVLKLLETLLVADCTDDPKACDLTGQELYATAVDGQTAFGELLADLAARLSGPDADDPRVALLEQDLARYREELALRTEELAEAGIRVARLKARLNDFGFSEEPSFFYLGRSSYDSVLRADDVPKALASYPRLNAVACAEALDWLDGNGPYTRQIWVWQNSQDLKLCKLSAGGGVALLEPGNEEAHVVILQ